MKRHGWVWGGWLAIAGLLAGSVACGASTVAGGTATIPAAVTTTTVDPWAVPAVVDVAYLQRVMDRLDQSLGDALRELVAAKSVDPKVDQILRAIYADPELSRSEHDYAAIATSGLANFRPVPGDPATTVQHVFSHSSDCAYFTARITLAASLVRPPPEAQTHSFVALRRAGLPSRLLVVNPTGFVIVLAGISTSTSTPKDPCAS